MGADTFGEWLKQRRKALDLTQDEFARRVGCAVSMLQKLEADERRPSPQMAESLARTLGIAANQHAAFVEFARSGRRATVGVSFHSPSNLPAPTTPLIGREHDVAAVCQRLMHEDTRLLTLVGPPGIGKTRLALQVATEVRDCFDDGVFFVALAPITDPALVAPTIIQTFGFYESKRLSPLDHLCDHLRDKLMLLVLDNLEQVIAAAPMIARLLAACPFLKILATSRVALRVRAERQYHVPPLGLPDLARLPQPQELVQYPALALFVERAQAVQPDFSLTEANAATVAHLCHRLDGLPLAIELIAARVRLLSPAEILRRLGGRFLLQSDGLRDIDERQRTLKNAIEWSYNLLTSDEQTLFARLAVFAGGWTVDAAESVCGNGASGLTTPVLDLLALLVNKSLVNQHEINGESRFTMLETIREYALEKLEATGGAEAVRRRHAEHYLAMMVKAGPDLDGSSVLLDRVEREHDNLRAALQWSLDRGEVEMAARLSLALLSLWTMHTHHLTEGRQWFRQVLAAARDYPLPACVPAKVVYSAGILAYLQSDQAAARPLLEEALTLARESGDRRSVAHALHGLSNVAMDEGQYERVSALLNECLSLARQMGDKWLIAMSLNNLAEVARLQGDFEQAVPMFEEGTQLLTELGSKSFMAILMDGLGTIMQYQGHYDRALAIHTQCLTLAHEMDDRRIIALSLEKLAGVAAGTGRAECAARLLGTAEALREAIQVPIESIDRPDYERFVAMARAGLDDESFATAWAKGCAMTMEQAIAYALSDVN